MSAAYERDGYRLMRNAASSSRLVTHDHYIWKQVCGFDIHPQIAPPVDQTLRVADVGTGTSIWMVDVKQKYPDLQIDGFDVSISQCPPVEFLPEGCSVHELDMLKAVPEKFEGIYDVVNLRLMMAAIKDDNPVPLLKNLITMLKPGGYLQWQEINPSTITVVSAKPALDRTIMDAILQNIHEWNFAKWVPHLSEICAQNGLPDSTTHRYPVPPEYRVAWCQTQLGAYEEISFMSMDNSSPNAKGSRFRHVLDKAYDELTKGVTLQHTLEVTTARKPA
ncbi:hypothetical protein MMC10_010016 [Thelotrema lepadinum]|nr:hypothetical protein [Thelotrema lepadinum]